MNILESGINIFEKYEVTGKVINENGNSLEGANIIFRNSNEDIYAETNSNESFLAVYRN